MTFTRFIKPFQPISALKLPEQTLQQIQGIAGSLRQDIAGNTVLLTGSSSDAANTAAAIAHDTNRELLRVDLGTIISRYIGETEKNLDRLLSTINPANSILFFDEADALFGKRTGVKDSHDRYANTEISYLLQRLESFPGLVIFAKNSSEDTTPDERFRHWIHLPR